MATKTNIQLPTEIWLRVLQHVKADKTELWTSLRRVSRAFKEGIETIFCERYLPDTPIHIHIEEFFTEQELLIDLDVTLSFLETLPEDDRIAIFAVEIDEKELYNDVRLQRLRAWHENSTPQDPGYIIQIRRDINDTVISSHQLNFSPSDNQTTLTLSLNWHDLYTNFYAEEAYYNELTKSWAKEQETWALDMHKRLMRGEVNLQEMMVKTVREFASGSERNRDRARRRRVEKQMRKGKGKVAEGEWDEEIEREVKERMKVLRRQIKEYEEYSDDESEEEDEIGDSEGSDEESDEEEGSQEEWADTDSENEDRRT